MSPTDSYAPDPPSEEMFNVFLRTTRIFADSYEQMERALRSSDWYAGLPQAEQDYWMKRLFEEYFRE